MTDDEDAPEPCPDCRAAATPRADGIWIGCCDAHAEVRRLTVVADPEDWGAA